MAIGAAIAGVVGAVGGGLLKKAGAKKAANAQERGAALIGEGLAKTEGEFATWRDVGQDATEAMALALGLPDRYGRTDEGRDLSGFEASPGYQFRMDQGTKAVERSAAARGSLQSGATMKALQREGQGEASQEFGNYMSQLAGLSGQGLQATSQLGALRTNNQANQANLMAGAGAARASGYNALAGGLEGALDVVGGFAGDKWG